MHRALLLGLDIKLCWVPSHVGIIGNEGADKLAASIKDNIKISLKLPYEDFKPAFRRAINKVWQSEWDREIDNKLHVIKPCLEVWESSHHKNRFHEVLMSRLRIGHSRLTHLHLLCGEDAPQCEHCGKVVTVLHILWNCRHLHEQRRACFPELFRYHLPFHPAFLLGDQPLVPFRRVLEFLKVTGYMHRL